MNIIHEVKLKDMTTDAGASTTTNAIIPRPDSTDCLRLTNAGFTLAIGLQTVYAMHAAWRASEKTM